MLPYSNTLMVVTLVGAQIMAMLEDALDNALAPTSNGGSYPYASGLRFAVDASKAKGFRLSRLEVNARLAGQWAAINNSASYVVVANSYIGGGNGGYTTFINGAGLVNTSIPETESLVRYARMVGTLLEAPVSEFSTQAYTNSSGYIATVPATLCNDRFPGTGRNTNCTKETTQEHGGAACQLVAKAHMTRASASHVAIQNGCGYRIDIPVDNFTVATA